MRMARKRLGWCCDIWGVVDRVGFEQIKVDRDVLWAGDGGEQQVFKVRGWLIL